VYGVKISSIYEKAVLETLKSGPKMRKELVEELCPRRMSVKKLQSTLNYLVDAEKIVRVPKTIGKTQKYTSFYALPQHKYKLETNLDEIAKAVKELRLELCRSPEVEEVAARIGVDPDIVKKLLFEHAPDLRWKPPTLEDREEAKNLRRKALELAAQAKYGLTRQIGLSEISVEDVDRAEFFLKREFQNITLEHIPSKGVIAGPGFPAPPSPTEKGKEDALKAVKELRRRFKACSHPKR
jgi:chaperonin cofactor prefoldin